MNIKNVLLGIAIFLLTLFVGIYGINTLYGKEPMYDNYCKNILSSSTCIEEGGKWVNYSSNTEEVEPRYAKPIQAGIENGYCEIYYDKCNKEFNIAQEKYRVKVFFIALPLGIIIIALGAIFFGLESVGAGLMAGGVGIIIYGVSGYWQYTKDWIRFLISLAGLIIVIWLSYYANRKWGNKK
ncbi:hypothetical protein HYW75_02270 [Candidatus Pacearchaeota archaeon]|nr:hypothetical protein [Candidatus Pacearchaeota archaeon]